MAAMDQKPTLVVQSFLQCVHERNVCCKAGDGAIAYHQVMKTNAYRLARTSFIGQTECCGFVRLQEGYDMTKAIGTDHFQLRVQLGPTVQAGR